MHSPYEKTLANAGSEPDTSDSECPPITGSELWPFTGVAVYVRSCPMRVMITPAATALPWNTNRSAKRLGAPFLAGFKVPRDFATFNFVSFSWSGLSAGHDGVRAGVFFLLRKTWPPERPLHQTSVLMSPVLWRNWTKKNWLALKRLPVV